jgi:hypothetical protein
MRGLPEGYIEQTDKIPWTWGREPWMSGVLILRSEVDDLDHMTTHCFYLKSCVIPFQCQIQNYNVCNVAELYHVIKGLGAK